jgi:hypothetical protein
LTSDNQHSSFAPNIRARALHCGLAALLLLSACLERPSKANEQTNAAVPEGFGPLASLASAATPRAPVEERISVRHLVVTFVGTGLAAHEKVTRTREQAEQRAEEARARALRGDDFDQLVREYSDEPGDPEKKGRLLNFKRKQAFQGFGDAAFALKVGEISEVVETQLGFHVIRRLP